MSDWRETLFLFWPHYNKDRDGERWGVPCVTMDRTYAQRFADAGAPVLEYKFVAECPPSSTQNPPLVREKMSVQD